ncbi:uncharacterized protein LOC128240856 isoform X1 [Mya arenaria]|uniref:uncharacterized protein LOC128240856 isoform X1 n=1 Tax=Mya arenaria TaxID=6604 RepID=UPI0022E703C4|nr:uncharacterized protein LOC128240856 isoform X1 [Mya arenaria]
MSAGISLHKDTPGFKVILRAVLKDQIQLLVQQLSTHGGEESLLLTSCIEDGSFSHLSSKRGSNFLERNEDVRLKFLNHVARDGSTKKLPIVTSPSSKRDSSNWRMRLGFSGFNSGSRKSPYERRTHRKSYRSQKSLNSKDCAPFTIRSQSAKNAEFTFETQSGSIIEPNVNKLIDGPIEREDVDGANIAEDQEYDPMISGTNEVEGDDNVNAVEAGNSVIVKVERLDGCVDDNLLDTNDYTIAPEVGTPASVTSSRVQQARPTSTKSDTDYTLAPESGTPASVNSPRSQHARSASPKSDTGLNSVVNKRKKAVPTRRPPGGTAFYPKESPFSVDTQSSEGGLQIGVIKEIFESSSHSIIDEGLGIKSVYATQQKGGYLGPSTSEIKLECSTPRNRKSLFDASGGFSAYNSTAGFNTPYGTPALGRNVSPTPLKTPKSDQLGILNDQSGSNPRSRQGTPNSGIYGAQNDQTETPLGTQPLSSSNAGSSKGKSQTPQIDGLLVSRGEGRYEKLIKCELCSKVCRTSNMARHRKQYCAYSPGFSNKKPSGFSVKRRRRDGIVKSDNDVDDDFGSFGDENDDNRGGKGKSKSLSPYEGFNDGRGADNVNMEFEEPNGSAYENNQELPVHGKDDLSDIRKGLWGSGSGGNADDNTQNGAMYSSDNQGGSSASYVETSFKNQNNNNGGFTADQGDPDAYSGLFKPLVKPEYD